MKWLNARFGHAFSGLRFCLQDKSIRFQLLLALCAILAGFLLRIETGEWLWVLAACFLVLITETVNSCLEKTVDYISPKKSPQARQIKDMAAAAVFLSALFAFFVAIFIYLPHLFYL